MKRKDLDSPTAATEILYDYTEDAGLDPREPGDAESLPPLSETMNGAAQPVLLRMAEEAHAAATGDDVGPPVAAAGNDMGSVGPDVILRALTQLLVEKGLVDRDELVRRLGRLSGRDTTPEA